LKGGGWRLEGDVPKERAMEPLGPCAAELTLHFSRRFWDVLKVRRSVFEFFSRDDVPSVAFWLLFGCHFKIGEKVLGKARFDKCK